MILPFTPPRSGMKSRKGFTLVELMVSSSIFVFLIMVLYGIIQAGTSVYFVDSTFLDLQQQARNAMDRIVREARESKSSTVIVVDADSDKFAFSTPSEGGVLYYRDGNNLIREYPPGTATIVATDITHLKFLKVGVQLMITLQAQKTAYNRTFTFPLSEDVKLRNE